MIKRQFFKGYTSSTFTKYSVEKQNKYTAIISSLTNRYFKKCIADITWLTLNQWKENKLGKKRKQLKMVSKSGEKKQYDGIADNAQWTPHSK